MFLDFFVFFKQKTAYEMRISDWSSDVCSSDLQSIGRWKVNAWQVPVLLRGATSKFVKVEPGDFILADADGAMIIPAQVIDQVLPEAEKLTSVEQQIGRAQD